MKKKSKAIWKDNEKDFVYFLKDNEKTLKKVWKDFERVRSLRSQNNLASLGLNQRPPVNVFIYFFSAFFILKNFL